MKPLQNDRDPRVRLADRIVGSRLLGTPAPRSLRTERAMATREWRQFMTVSMGSIIHQIKQAQKFSVDEVAQYYYEVRTEPTGNKAVDFLVCIPPFEQCWIEAQAPAHILLPSGEWQAWDDDPERRKVKRFGVLMESFDRARWEHRTPEVEANLRTMFGAGGAEFAGEFVREWVRDEAAWIITSTLIVELDTGKAQGLLPVAVGMYTHTCDAMGQLLRLKDTESTWQFQSMLPMDEATVNHGQEYTFWMDPLLLSLSFMSCTNVGQVTQVPNKKLSALYARRHRGVPLHTFTTLVLGRTHERVAIAGTDATTGRAVTRFHLVRGHLRRLPEVGPSGRRYTKRLTWVRPHTRGDLTEGDTYHDYEVRKTP